jgi:dolichyl-phosphate beta-glucosyltransferase
MQIGYLDADGAFSVEDVKNFASPQIFIKLGEYEAIWSSRVKLAGRRIRRNSIRHFLARFLSALLTIKFSSLPYDSQSGLKIFTSTPMLCSVFSEPFLTRWLFEIEILCRWQALNGDRLKIWEEPVLQWEDVSGSNIKGLELIRIFVEFLKVLSLKRIK